MLKNCNTTKHYWKQLMALFLCVTIIAQLLPARVHAQEVTSTSDTTAAEQVSLDILGEDVTRRTATSKHYRTSDGGYIMMQYNADIHYQDSSGAWLDVDNELVHFDHSNNAEIMNSASQDAVLTGYVNRANKVEFLFSENLNSGVIYQLSEDGYKVVMGLAPASAEITPIQPGLEVMGGEAASPAVSGNLVVDEPIYSTATASIMTDTESTVMTYKNEAEEVAALDHIKSGIEYHDVYPGVDLRYELIGTSMKETIIITEPAKEYKYTFLLTLDGLNARLTEKGNIELYDPLITDEEEAVNYVIPAPFMKDSNFGRESSRVHYELGEMNANGEMLLTVVADAEWINSEETVFPVEIDPSTVQEEWASASDTYVIEGSPTEDLWASSALIAGWSGFGDRYRIYWKYEPLPDLPDASIIVNAQILLYQFVDGYGGYQGSETMQLGVRSCSEWWSLDPYFYWDLQPEFSDVVLDYKEVSAATNGTYVGLDITSLVQGWYAGTRGNYGVVIMPVEEYNTSNAATTRAAVQFASCNWGGSIHPKIMITYRDAKGIEDYWTYHTQSVGDAGTGYINDFTGNLTFVHNDMSSIGGVLPIHAEHVYTGYLARAYYNKYNTLTTDFEFMIIGAGWKLGSQETVVTTTIGNTEYYVHSDRDGTEHYYYNQDNDAAYESEDGLKYEITKNSDGSFTMTDEYGGVKYFNTDGRMARIQDVNGNKKLYNYVNGQLVNIQEQNNGGTLRTIMTFSYYNNFLTGMTDGLDSGDTVTYYYSNGPQGTTLYSGTELIALDKIGVTSVGYLRKIVHSKGGTTTFEYNSDGYLIQVRDEETKGKLTYEYAATGSMTGHVSKVTEYGYNFSNNTQVQGQSMGITYSGHKTTVFRTSGLDDVYGNSDDLVTTYVMDHFGRTVCQYTTDLNSTDLYAASNAVYSNGTDSFKTKHAVIQSASTGGWATSGSSVDAEGVNNELGNGEFASTASWDFSTGATASGNQLVIDGSHLSARNASQTITFNAPGTQTYILSGWAKADAVPKEKSDSLRTFELRAEITYSDNVKEIQTVVFNTDVTEWQFASGGIVPKETTKTVKSITVYCAFDHQPNIAYFDHIRLTTEPSPTYKYDSDGKLTNITAEDGTSQGLVYSGVDLTSESLPNGDKYTYTYKTDSSGNSTHQVATVTDSNGVKASYNYDAYGNMISTVIEASGMSSKVSASSTYASDGRFLSTITDALGHTVTYGTNTSTGLQTYVQDPAGNRIAYSYNTDEYLTNAWMDTDKDGVMDSTEAGVIYGYLYDRLSTIQTRSSKYYYSYDPYSGVSSIGVGSASSTSAAYTLRSYTYNGNGGKLNAMTFGNGTKESYTYDAADRLISIAYGSNVKYQYSYNDDNQLSLVWDKYNNIKTELVYDRIGRLATATTKYLNSDGSVKETMTTGYVYDNAGRLDSLTYTIGSTTMTYDAAYKTNSDLINTFAMPNATIHYSYDALQRMTDQRIKNSSGTVLGGQSYSYQAGSGSNSTSTIVNRVTMDKSGNYFDYTYDSRGNITQVKKNGSVVAAYTYDAQNQLLSETYGGKTWTYTYDKAGNILSVSDGTTTNNYGYSTSWGDLLTSYKGTSITYDNAGNPLSYYNGKNYTFTWTEGNRLASAVVNNTTTSYTYTEGGIRNSKTVGSVKTQYYLDGSRIVRENRNGTVIDYYYDDLGNVVGFKYNNNYYYYGRNLQGDVVELYCNGSLVGQYEYDAWGQILAVKNGSGATITSSTDPAMVNPFRYRGYYYDTETGLYYLNSRYYDPAVKRFINGDEYVSTGQGVVGFNMFSYCLNNPINREDIHGTCSYVAGSKHDCGRSDCPQSNNYIPYTVSLGGVFSGGIGPLAISVQVSLATDSEGKSEIQLAVSAPNLFSTGLPSVDEMLANSSQYKLGGSFAGTVTITNTPTVEELHGSTYSLGGAIPGIAVDYNAIAKKKGGKYDGITITFGAVTPGVNFMMSETLGGIKVPFSVFDLIEAAFNGVYGR